MTITPNYQKTLRACYLGYVTQAICANFAPLLFLTFQKSYHISLGELALIPTVFFLTQLMIDLAAANFVDRIGYRTCVVAAHGMAAVGLVLLAFLPDLLPVPFLGILISVMVYAVSSGLIEVLISPIVEACPFENKASRMSLLHSFYCWGMVAVVLGSTVFFALFGLENWRILALLWALIPLWNVFNFIACPIERLVESGEGMGIASLLRLPLFWLLVLLMVCSGAAENAMTQWASAFAEAAIGVPKTLGDLAGPCLFAALMGASRVLCAKMSHKMELGKIMLACGVPVYKLLLGGVPVGVPGGRAGRLRVVRIFRRYHVAGHPQSFFPGLSQRRYGDVRLFGAGRGPGRHNRANGGGVCIRGRRRRSEKRIPCCGGFPHCSGTGAGGAAKKTKITALPAVKWWANRVQCKYEPQVISLIGNFMEG